MCWFFGEKLKINYLDLKKFLEVLWSFCLAGSRPITHISAVFGGEKKAGCLAGISWELEELELDIFMVFTLTDVECLCHTVRLLNTNGAGLWQ